MEWYQNNLIIWSGSMKEPVQVDKYCYDVDILPVSYTHLDVYKRQIEYGEKVIQARKKFVSDINEIISEIHKKLTGNQEQIEVIYEPNTGGQSLGDVIQRNRERDLRMMSTTSGPHRDDICFQVDGIDIRKFGSQGQQRTCLLYTSRCV